MSRKKKTIKEKFTPLEAAQRRIAANIRRLREERGLSQMDLLIVHGFEQRHFRRVEAGKRNMTVKFLVPIAEAFEVDISDLLRIVDKSQAPGSGQKPKAKK